MSAHRGLVLRRALRFLPEPGAADAVARRILGRVAEQPEIVRRAPSPATWLFAEATGGCIPGLRARRARGESIRLAAELPGLRPSAARDRQATAVLNRLLVQGDDGAVILGMYAFADEMTEPEIARILGVDRAVIGARIAGFGVRRPPAVAPDITPEDGFGDLFDRAGHLTPLTIERLLAGELAVKPDVAEDRITGPLVVHLMGCAPCRDALGAARAADVGDRPGGAR